MSSDHDDGTCEFGHVFEVYDEGDEDQKEIRKKIKKEEIVDLDDLRDEMDVDNSFLKPIMGGHMKDLKVSAGSQGTPHSVILLAADKFGDELGWNAELTEEQIYVSPQSQFHNDYIQKKQQAEQAVKQNMQSIAQLKKEKHMLEHDIRKLRSRVENLREGDEAVLKGDFVQLVDGAGAQGQGADQQALRSLRDNNFYPTIVSDFYEMSSVDDLKPAEDRDDDKDGKLADLPANEKAILKKKYTMYEKWKDLFGSEVQKKLEELKGELQRIQRALKEAKNQVEEPVRDMVMINQKSHDQLKDDFGRYFSFQRHSTEIKNFEFIARKGLKKEEGSLVEVGDDEATHYKIFYIHAVHVNIAGSEDPRTPQEGPTTARVFYHSALVCEHVYENIFEPKENWLENRFDEVMDDYTGDIKNEEGEKLREAREEEGLSIGDLRRELDKELDDENVPLEFSALLRRVEDGLDDPEIIREKYNEDYLEAINDILGESFGEDEEEHEDPEISDLKKKMKKFFGFTDQYYIEDPGGYVSDMDYWFRFNYYYDMKKTLGLYTMN